MDRIPATNRRYPAELRGRAVKMVFDLQRGDPNDHSVIGRVSCQLGIGTESLRSWVKRVGVEAGTVGGMTDARQAELKELRKEVRELRRANAILQDAATNPPGSHHFFRVGGRPSTAVTVAFIDAHRDRFPVAAICRVLELPERTFYAAKTRPASARAVADVDRTTLISDKWKANYSCYRARRLHSHPVDA